MLGNTPREKLDWMLRGKRPGSPPKPRKQPYQVLLNLIAVPILVLLALIVFGAMYGATLPH